MDIMSLLGHTTLQMTSRYTHATPENLRTAVDSLTKGRLSLVPKLANSHAKPSLTVGLPTRSARSAPSGYRNGWRVI